MNTVDLLNELSAIVGKLRETAALEDRKADLTRQIGQMEQEIASVRENHRVALEELRAALQANEAIKQQHAETAKRLAAAKAEAKELFATGA